MQVKGGKGTKYSWILSTDGVVCYKNPTAFQTLTNLWEAGELSTWHDADLAKATKKINTILGDLEKKNKDSKRKLSFVQFQNRHFLVWANYGFVGPDDDDATIEKTLRLKQK
ncbi:MAG TPA: hypothetical protein VGI13_10940 [Candidatus Acidoferrum sp.]|jgi:hypothetical protein